MSLHLPSLSHHRGFVAFWLSLVCSGIALEMTSLAVAWQMYATTGKASDLGLIGLAHFVPALLLALPGGHLADRYDRRSLVMVADLLGAVAALALAMASLTHSPGRGWLLAAVGLGGAAAAIRRPALQSLVPGLVPKAMLAQAYAATSVAGEATVVAGPVIGGLLYLTGSLTVYAAAGGLMVGSALLLARLRYVPEPLDAGAASAVDLFAGLRFIRARPDLLGIISLDLFAVLLGGATALLPMFAKDILHAGPTGLALLRIAPSVGALLLGLWLSRHPPQHRVGMRMFGCVAGFGVATIVFGLSTHLWLSMLALAALGAFDMVSVVIRGTLMQMETPGHMRGRVGAVNGMFIGTSNQLGEFESGMLAAWLGAVPAVVIGGCGTLMIVALWMRLFPSLRHRNTLKCKPDVP
ncbi:MAG: Enterobactin exporter EntS [Luteibacter sp.]|uniref:MFS transporter n=1 Tax=Luteibacter sp. TaxID=1886636 RepID=UPI00137E4DF1|nr:MFS transporter [Luteibacter sp.]KAF1008898.1 MAG: Enterobactin exporter EntS [Luteibacter sp.]